VVFILLATLLATTIAPIAVLLGESPTDYRHLAGTTFASQRYYLALQQPPSESPSMLLYCCDALGAGCRALDALSTGTSDRQSADG
jgi:hypothetical protein